MSGGLGLGEGAAGRAVAKVNRYLLQVIKMLLN